MHPRDRKRERDRDSLDRILELLDDKVEVVPSIVGKEAGIEGESDLGHVRFRVVPREVLSFACKRDVEKGYLIPTLAISLIVQHKYKPIDKAGRTLVKGDELQDRPCRKVLNHLKLMF